jgi:ABC-type antimicrobial peptide transport system ATPase subunit
MASGHYEVDSLLTMLMFQVTLKSFLHIPENLTIISDWMNSLNIQYCDQAASCAAGLSVAIIMNHVERW